MLLHGMGGTADLWRPVMAELDDWPGPIVALDLPGHGRSPRLADYGPGNYAAAVAEDLAAFGEGAVILGHSLGGLVALALGTGWFGLRVAAVIGVGIKVNWSDEDLAGAGALRERPVRSFPTRDAAAERFVLVNGLRDVLEPSSPWCDGGIVSSPSAADAAWCLAHDPQCFSADRPPVRDVFSLVRVPVTLACGAADAMVSASDLASLGAEPVVIAGAGHNVHVEAPAAVADLALAALGAVSLR